MATKDVWTLEEVVAHIEDSYEVVYRSPQSYILCCNKQASVGRRRNPCILTKNTGKLRKKTQIQELLATWRAEIASGQVRVLFLDECHLLWGEVSGYEWSRRNQRVDVEVKSTKDRQTFYGALDYLTKRFAVHEYSAGNQEHTVAFLKYLQLLFQESTRLVIIWDGASYHRSAIVREFLQQVNRALPPEQWSVTCIRLAPNAPEQNPVEDVWLQAKRFLRKYARLCKNFGSVKMLFKLITHCQTLAKAKVFMYGYCSCPI